MADVNISKEFRLKNIDGTGNYLIEQVNRTELISKKHKYVCATLIILTTFLILSSTITGCVSISAFANLVSIPIEIKSSATGLKICAITATIKN